MAGACLAAATPGTANAAEPAPAWSLRAVTTPTRVSSAKGGNIVVLAINAGNAATASETVTLRDTLPAGGGMEIASATLERTPVPDEPVGECTVTAETATCVYEGEPLKAHFTDALEMNVHVVATAASGSTTTTASVSGGGAPERTATSKVEVGEPAGFGLQNFSFEDLNEEGAPEAQAGSHPYSLAVGLDLNSIWNPAPFSSGLLPAEPAKSVVTELPIGLIGNPQAAAKCPQYLLRRENGIHCPTASIVGSVLFGGAIQSYRYSKPLRAEELEPSPIFDVTPEKGYPAEFAFNVFGETAFIYATVNHTSAGYVVKATVPAVPTAAVIRGVELAFFGDPAAEDGEAVVPAPLFTNPTNCASAGEAVMTVNSWLEPHTYVTKRQSLPTATGCNLLHFAPKMQVRPETTQVDTPTGMTVDLAVPQNEDPEGLATPDVKQAKVTFPLGVTVSPPAANGLRGCQESGPEGIDLYAEGPVDASEPDGPQTLVHGNCPPASRIGKVKITTPVLPEPLEGSVYLAQPKCGGAGQAGCTEADAADGSLFSIYIEAEGSGVNIKLPASVSVDPTTGRISTTVSEAPQLPFSDFQLTLTGGPYAPVANPQTCGAATTEGEVVPWSTPATATASLASYFDVDSNGAGGACPATAHFAPSFTAGVVESHAASSTDFTLTVGRTDGQQDLGQVSTVLAPGLVGMISQVPLCQEPQAAAGTCSSASQIGTTDVASGSGSDPLWLGGTVYMTSGYKGAPFGMDFVVPAVAGPFNLGDVVVRATVNVDPNTGVVSVSSDPLPQKIDGVPFRLKVLNVDIDRTGFIRTPTNCSALSVQGTISSVAGTAVSVSNPFAVGGCASLPFKPSFTAATKAETSRLNGASFNVKVAFPAGAEANIKSVKVILPKQLPSRQSTLKLACRAAVFDANPANCPAGSVVGTATAHTPVLPVALTGPAYFVSNGSEAFPDLILALQGDGVRIDLTGHTLIRKGITSSTFATVPDVPVSSFALNLPQSPHSALGAYGSLCKNALHMPTTIVGQNGATIEQTTNIKVSGCPKHRKKPKSKKK
jgi:hypothetical protein